MKRDTNDLWPLRAGALLLIFSLFSAFSMSADADTYRQGKTTLVSRGPSGEVADGAYPSVSGDGRYVAFDSYARLSPLDGDVFSDVYVRDMTTGTFTLVSPDLAGVSVDRCNHKPSISTDGTKVVYLSGFAFGFLFVLSQDCANSGNTVILRDLPASTSSVVNLGGFSGVQATVSGDGRSIAVVASENESSGDNIMVFDSATMSRRFSEGICAGGCGLTDPGLSISNDGRFVAFDSQCTFSHNFGCGDWDVYVHDRDTDGNGVFDEPGKTFTKLGGVLGDGSSPYTRWGAISGDGKHLIFLSRRFGGTTSDPYYTIQLRNLVSSSNQEVARLQIPPDNSQLFLPYRMGLSTDGRYSVFTSFYPLVPTDLSPGIDAYVWDRDSGNLELVSLRPDGNQGAEDAIYPSISSDGRHVAYAVWLVSFDRTIRLRTGVYLRDRSVACDLACIPSGV